MYEKIKELNQIRAQQQQLAHREQVLLTPLLTDTNELETLYRWFQEIEPEAGMKSRHAIRSHKKFMLLVLLLYSPATLTGKKIANGIREKLAQFFNLSSRSGISNNCQEMIFLYLHYKNFREEMELIYTEIQQKLQNRQQEIEKLSEKKDLK